MDFSTPAYIETYRDEVKKFASSLLTEDFADREQSGTFSRAAWDACAEFGLLKLMVPRAYGGQDEEVDLLKAVVAMEGFGFGCPDGGLALGLNAQMWTVQLTFVHHASDAQKEKFLPKLASGHWLGSHALTEEQAGSDVYSMQTIAEKVEGGYVLNGGKRLIGMAPLADVIVIFANARPKMGTFGITGFILERGMDGLKTSASQQKMGLRTHPFGEIELKDCFVPDENRLGGEGAGFGICNHSLEFDRCGILASHIGAMERQLEECIAFAKKRKQFGQPISKFQSISNRVADMRLRLETARLLLYKLVWLKQQNKPAMLEASMLKLLLSENFVESSLDAIRIHGGISYLSGHNSERDLRDAVGGILYAGTSDIQRNIIAKFMGL
ncbi:MAG: acyl-CoA dehydrogenase family protein [Bacteroidota bacterium]